MGRSEGQGSSHQEVGKGGVTMAVVIGGCQDPLPPLEPPGTKMHTPSSAILFPPLWLLPARGNPGILLRKGGRVPFFLEPGEEVSQFNFQRD